MDEAKLVHNLNSKSELGHVKARNVFRKDFVLDEHGHQVAAWEELHEEIQEGVVLEGREQLHDPSAVRLGEDISLCANVRKLIFLVLD